MGKSDMGGGAARSSFGTAQGQEGTLGERGTSAFNAAMPTLMTNASNPQGMTPGQLAAANTANQQSIGGSTAGITGQANLTAGRTGNPGSMVNAIGSASRGQARNLAQNALGIQEQNTQMAQQKQQAALGELGKLYGTNVSGMNEMMGNMNKATSNITAADQAQHAATMGEIGMGMQAGGMLMGA